MLVVVAGESRAWKLKHRKCKSHANHISHVPHISDSPFQTGPSVLACADLFDVRFSIASTDSGDSFRRLPLENGRR